MTQDFGEILGKNNRSIIQTLSNAPFSIRERKGRFYARASLSLDGQTVLKEFSMGGSLDMSQLLALWQDIEKVKSGNTPIDLLDKWGKQKKRSLNPETIGKKESISICEAIALFEKDFWSKRSPDNLKAQTTWKGYQEVICKIHPSFLNNTASVNNLVTLTIDNSSPETRKREKWVLVCGILARFAGAKDTTPIKKLKGNRSAMRLSRYIPTDEEINAIYSSIEDEAWRWVFGILAAYGLRPSELFHLNFERIDKGIIQVGSETKTGERLVYPLLKEWHREWGLSISPNYPHNLIPETLTHLTNRDKATRISRKFKSLNLGFVPYALRDAYAIRGAVLGISPSVISQWMGHSLSVHFSAYQRYISEREWTQIWNQLD